MLLDAGADPDARTDEGESALYWAASAGHAAVVTVLLESGAAANPVRECGWSALTAAIYNGHEELAEQLVEAGANAGHQCYGESMYSWAVRHGRADRAVPSARGLYR